MTDPIDYVMQFGGRCRECADTDGTCPYTKMPCNSEQCRAVIKQALKAWKYGVNNGFLENPIAS